MEIKFKILIIICLGQIFMNCRPNSIDNIDIEPAIEKAPEFIPDSPMWRKLASPSNGQIINDVYRTEKEELYTCQFSRSDTASDSNIIDNKSFLYFNGNIDANTITNGIYFPASDNWILNKTSALPRFDPLRIGPIAKTIRDVVNYGYYFGSGYAINEDFPNGIKYFQENWMTDDISIIGVPNPKTLLTGVVANNVGYLLENNKDKTLWELNNIGVFDKKEPFGGELYGKFTLATTIKANKLDEFVFLLSESEDQNIKTKELYQLNTATYKWTKKSDFPGEDRYNGVFFGIGDNLYYGLGQSKTEANGFRDIWQYDTKKDKWISFAIYPGSGNVKVASCIVAGKVYIGLGYYVKKTSINTEKYIGVTDFWEFVPTRK